jgi:hypothetical protein
LTTFLLNFLEWSDLNRISVVAEESEGVVGAFFNPLVLGILIDIP